MMEISDLGGPSLRKNSPSTPTGDIPVAFKSELNGSNVREFK